MSSLGIFDKETKTYKKVADLSKAAAVDDSLSQTSTNPVQNKVVTSNLTDLKYGEVAGGKNLADLEDVVLESAGMIYSKVPVRLPMGTYTLSWYTTNTSGKIDIGLLTANNTHAYSKTFIPVTNGSLTFTISDDAAFISLFSDSAITIKNVQIEKGTTATPYEPYIPSVKILADEVSAQKNDLGGLSFSVSGTTLSITDGTNTWTLSN